MTVSIPLRYENVKDIKKDKSLTLGVFKPDMCDEGFKFHPTKNIRMGDSYCDEKHYSLTGGARTGYYMRMLEEDHWPSPEMSFPNAQKQGRTPGLRVNSNDTCTSYETGHQYTTSIVFPKRQFKRGVREFLELIKEKSEPGIIKSLSSQDFERLTSFIAFDLRTRKHTKEALRMGQELDAAFM